MTSIPPILIETANGHKDLLWLHAAFPERYPHLLESAAQGPHGRFDILFAFPGETLQLGSDRGLAGPHAHTAGAGFLGAFDAWWEQERRAPDPEPRLPFRGGWFVYLGYELAGQIEPRLGFRGRNGNPAIPIAVATRFPAAIIRDHHRDEIHLVVEHGNADLLEQMHLDLDALAKRPHSNIAPVSIRDLTEEPAGNFLQSVERILHYIREGDVFQVNLSRAWAAEFGTPPGDADLYRRLRRHNPGPFSGLATWPWGGILSSSPERLVRVRGRSVETRPIAGTRPRGRQPREDQSLSAELLAHPKEQAEHIMLIDLERNDLGRVCATGTIEVNELMTLESFAHVHHIVSNVRGRLRAGVRPGEVLAAVFPGGTITGCPKVRCMEIIAELETEWRGPYTGSIGYVNRDGDMDFNILIRTMVRSGSGLQFRAGAGIVADSEPHRELEETRAKARGLLFALAAFSTAVADSGV